MNDSQKLQADLRHRFAAQQQHLIECRICTPHGECVIGTDLRLRREAAEEALRRLSGR